MDSDEPVRPIVDWHRRAIIFLSEEDLKHILNLPEGCTVQGVRDDFHRNGVQILINGLSLEPVAVGAVPPTMHMTREYFCDENDEITGLRMAPTEEGSGDVRFTKRSRTREDGNASPVADGRGTEE